MKRTAPVRRTPLRQGKPLRSTQPIDRTGHIATRSKKRARQERTYAKLRAEFLTANPWCAASLEGCTGRATEVHHAHGRMGAALTDVSNFVPLCHADHEWVTAHPREAIALGLSELRIGGTS